MNEENLFRLRLLIVAFFMFCGFGVLAGKLWYEQIRGGERYRASIARQSVRRVRLSGLRGRIFTSDYLLVADSAPRCNLVFYLQEMRLPSLSRTVKNIRATAAEVSAVLKRPDTLTEERIWKHIRTLPGEPLEVYRDLDDVELALVFRLMARFPGLGVEAEPVRRYPEGAFAAGVIGYARPSDVRGEPDRRDFFYYHADLTGRSGVERVMEHFRGGLAESGLRGAPGCELIQVDHLGFVSARQLEKVPPVNGNHVVLTLDSRAQKLGEKLLAGQTGALVLLDADTGAALALVSSPSYDLGRVSPVWRTEYYQELLDDPAKPLFARAFQGTYTPGSIMKPLVALAALNDGFDPATVIDCDGRSLVGGAKISCNNRWGHGPLTLKGALEKSCNDYFIEMGVKLGMEKIAAMFQAAGIGQAAGLEIGGSVGLLPRRELKNRRFRGPWNSYDTALISIGQGLVLLSPVQAARFTAALANGGRLVTVHLLKEIVSDTGRVLYRQNPAPAPPWSLREGALETVREGMFRAVNSPGGSGRNAHSDKLVIYGKTGTAEVDVGPRRINNTWFIAFTSYRGRRYALAVLIEEGRSGGRDCAPLAKEFLERFLLEGV